VLRAVALDYLLSHMGMFALLPILALFARDQGSSPAGVGLALAAFTFALRASGLFTAGWLTAVSDRAGASAAMLTTAVALGVLAAVPAAPLLPLLLLVGVGVNSNGLLVRCMLNRNIDPDRRAAAYGTVNIAVNLAAAIGPFLGLFGYRHYGAGPVFAASGALYAAAAVAILLAPRETTPADTGRVGLVETWRELLRLARRRNSARLIGTTVFGYLAYAQLYSALPLFLADVLGRPGAVATVFAANAVTIVVLQRPTTAAVTALARRGWTHLHCQVAGLGLFSVSFLLLCLPRTGLAGVLVGIVVFSVAEALFTPAVDAAFADLPSTHRLAPVNLRHSVNAAGETVGAFCGGTLYLVLAHTASPSVYWLSVSAATAAVGSLVALSLVRPRPRRRRR